MISTEFKGKLALHSCNLGEKGDTFDSYTFFLHNKSFYTLHDFMHQSIPPALSPPPPPPPPPFWHARGFLSEYNYKEGFTGRKADWLICHGQE